MKKILIILFLLSFSGCVTNDEPKKMVINCGLFESKEKCETRKLKEEEKFIQAKKKYLDNQKDIDNLKTINTKKVKDERQEVVNTTVESGPTTGFINKKKPRRALSANQGKLDSNTMISGPVDLITINFNNVNLSEGLNALGRLVGRNVIVSEKVEGNRYLNFQIYNQPWNDVFNSILEMYKLTFVGGQNNNILRIYTLKEKMSEYSSASGLDTEVFNIFYNKPSDISKQISSLFPGNSAEGDDAIGAASFMADDLNKTLIVQGVKSQINSVEEILNTLDVKKAQILIEAFIVEVSPKFERKLGSRLGIAGNTLNAADSDESKIVRGIAGTQLTTPTDTLTPGTDENSVTSFLVGGSSGLGIIAKTSTQQLKIEIDALETEGDSKTLSNPKVFTVSGKNAKITQGTNLVIEQEVTAVGVVTTTKKFIPVILELDVTPTVTGDGTIELLLKIKRPVERTLK
jgi:type IV pilus assembly protein PilQ